MKKTTLAVGLLLTAFLVGCGGDINFPKVTMIEVKHSSQVVASVEPSKASETTISKEVPTDAAFLIYFDEPILLTSAEEKIRIVDARSKAVSLKFSQRLEVITIRPSQGSLTSGMNHIIEIDRGIDDTSGNPTMRNYKINFFTRN
jgi:hypothetical protein